MILIKSKLFFRRIFSNNYSRTNDLDFAEKRIARLEDEVRDQIVRDDEDGNALNQLKREKREMDHQVEELREELDEALSELERAEQERDRLRVSFIIRNLKVRIF